MNYGIVIMNGQADKAEEVLKANNVEVVENSGTTLFVSEENSYKAIRLLNKSFETASHWSNALTVSKVLKCHGIRS